METPFYNISQVLGITIIHSLWQGLIIYLLLRILLLCLPSLSSVKKYSLSVIALLGITIWFASTFYTEAHDYNWSPITAINANTVMHFNLPDDYTIMLPVIPAHYASFHDYKSILYNAFKSYLPYISVLYTIGLIINLSGLVLAWNRIRIIKQNLALAEKLQQQVIRFSQQLHIGKFIQVGFSRLVDVPCVIGYFKPILLLPVTLTTQLSAEEIEAILLHELAHIKSNDYLFNLVQQMISVMLFFNPFAWLINRIISRERENRCDDMVVQTTGSPLVYAHALLKLEENRQTGVKLALAATGKKHHLLTRIERIMQAKKPMVNTRHLALAIIIFTGSLVSISWLNPEIKSGKIVSKNAERVISKLSSIIKMQPEKSPKANQPIPEKFNKIADAGNGMVTAPAIASGDTIDHKPTDSADKQAQQTTLVNHNGFGQPDKHYNYVLDGAKADEKTISQLGPLVLGSALIEHTEDAAKLSYQFDNDDDVIFLFTKKGTDLGNEVKEKLRKMNGLASIPSGAFVYEPTAKVAPIKDVPPLFHSFKNGRDSIPSGAIVYMQPDKIAALKDYHPFKKNGPVIIASARQVITRQNKTYYYGNVIFISGHTTIKADTVIYDRETEKANANGHVTAVTKTKEGNVTASATTGIFSLTPGINKP